MALHFEVYRCENEEQETLNRSILSDSGMFVLHIQVRIIFSEEEKYAFCYLQFAYLICFFAIYFIFFSTMK